MKHLILVTLVLLPFLVVCDDYVWDSQGKNLLNNRYVPNGKVTANSLELESPTHFYNVSGSVSATPAIDDDNIYFPS
jgi:hypothetical protein